MNKNELLKRRKLAANSLPKYDLAIKPAYTNSGYQMGEQVNTSGFTSTPGANVSNLAPAARRANVQSITSNLLGQGSQVANLLGGSIAKSASKAVPRALAHRLGQSATQFAPDVLPSAAGAATLGATTTSAITPTMVQVGSLSIPSISYTPSVLAGNSAGSTAATGAAGSGASAALSTTGYITAGLGAAYGLYDMGRNWFADNTFSEGEMLNSAGTATQTAEGVDYTTRTGINENAYREAVAARDTGSQINSAISGAGSGAAIGTMIAPGIGTLIGGLGGLLTGLFGWDIFGGESKEEQERKINNVNKMIAGSNLQNEYAAASTGMRNKFNTSHGEKTGIYNADKGMDAYMSPKSKTAGEYRPVWTPDGVEYGPVGSLVGKGESIIDYDRGKASIVDKGTKRVDNQASIAQEGDNIIIAGNDTDWETGESFANLVAPYTKMVEHANNIIDNINKKGSPATQELQKSQAEKMKLYALNKMKPITDRQQLQHEYEAAQQEGLYRADKGMDAYSFGKRGLRKYNDAKKNLNIFEKEAMNFLPYALMAAPIIEQGEYYRGNTPYAENPYVGNATARQALTTLGRLRADNYNQLSQAADSNRQNLYTINNLAGITPGQRLAMLTANNNNYAKLRASIAASANDENNKYKQSYASALLSEGREDAKARMQANIVQQQNYRDAIAKWRKGIETYGINRNNLIASALQNRFKNLMAGRTLNMYQQELDRKERELALAYKDRQSNYISLPQENLPVWRDGFLYGDFFA